MTQKDRLDDSRSNLYADQLNRGFRGLRFLPELERDYRRYMLEDSFALKRIALSVGMLVWLAFIGIDLLILAGPPLWGVLAVRLGVLVLLLVCGCLIMLRRHIQLMVPLSIACVLALGVGAAAVVGLAHRADPGYPYEGLLLVSFAAYFLAGLRLSQALSCALVVLLAYLGFEWWAGTQEPLGNNLLFLLFGNLIGAVGCYLLEFKSREHFLIIPRREHAPGRLRTGQHAPGLQDRRALDGGGQRQQPVRPDLLPEPVQPQLEQPLRRTAQLQRQPAGRVLMPRQSGFGWAWRVPLALAGSLAAATASG